MHLQYIIPEALNRLRINPLVGYLGDGEIMEAIAQVNENEWDENSIVTSMLSSFVEEFLCLLKNNELNFPEDKEVYSDQEREEYYQLLLKIKNTLQNLNTNFYELPYNVNFVYILEIIATPNKIIINSEELHLRSSFVVHEAS